MGLITGRVSNADSHSDIMLREILAYGPKSCDDVLVHLTQDTLSSRSQKQKFMNEEKQTRTPLSVRKTPVGQWRW